MRLIEAELTAKNIARYRAVTLEAGNDEMNQMMEGYNPSAFAAGFDYGMELAQRVVSGQPTTYDVKSVVEQLEELSAEHPYKVIGKPDTYSQYNEAWEDCSGRAIEIVKSGGKV